MPDYEMCKKNFAWLHEQIIAGNILSCMTIKMGGIAEALTKMTFGNRIGLEVKNLGENFFQLAYGSFILESEQELSFDNLEYLGKTI